VNNYFHIDFHQIPENEVVTIERNFYYRKGNLMNVGGNDREFHVPAGRFVSASICLVNTDPSKRIMPLPQGLVVVRDPKTNQVIEIGTVLKKPQTVLVETPNTGGVSNWGGIDLEFEML